MNPNYCSSLTAGIYKLACDFKKAGIKSIYATNKAYVDTVVITANEISAITMNLDPITALPYHWFPIAIQKQSGLVDNIAVIGTNNKTINQSIKFNAVGMNTAEKSRFEEMIKSDLVFIAEDYNGTVHMIGRKDGALLTTGNIATGTANDDLYGSTYEFLAENELEATKTVFGASIDYVEADGITLVTVQF